MVLIESDCADAMQASQETREEAGKLGRNVFPNGGANKARRKVGARRLDGEEMSCRSICCVEYGSLHKSTCREANNRRPHAGDEDWNGGISGTTGTAGGDCAAAGCRGWVGREESGR